MPAAATDTKDRERRAKRLSQVMTATGLSRRRIARLIAASRDLNAMTLETNLKRWSGAPRQGAVDAAPDWIFEAIAALEPAMPEAVAAELRSAAERQYVSPGLATRAALAIEGLLARVR